MQSVEVDGFRFDTGPHLQDFQASCTPWHQESQQKSSTAAGPSLLLFKDKYEEVRQQKFSAAFL